MRWLDGITDSMDMNLSKHQEIVKDRGAWHAAVHGAPKSRTRLVTECSEKRVGLTLPDFKTYYSYNSQKIYSLIEIQAKIELKI